MSINKDSQNKKLVFQLCTRFTEKQDEAFDIFRTVIGRLESNPADSTNEYAETFLAGKIKKTLQLSNRSQFICKFDDLHRRLQTGGFLKNRQAILSFLWKLADSAEHKYAPASQLSSGSTVPTTNILSSTMINSYQNRTQQRTHQSYCIPDLSPMSISHSASPLLNSSRPTGFETLGLTPLHVPGSTLQSVHSDTTLPNGKMTQNYGDSATTDNALSRCGAGEGNLLLVEQRGGSVEHSRSTLTKTFISEDFVVKELIFSFQGISGNLLKLDAVTSGFKLDPGFTYSRAMNRMVLRLTELSWLHNKLRHFCEEAEQTRNMGLMEKCLVGAFRDELTEYYRLVSILQSEAQQKQWTSVSVDSPLSEVQIGGGTLGGGSLTLRHIAVWAWDPTARLRCLVGVAETCTDRKGGALASAVYTFLHNGVPSVSSTVQRLLAAVCKPLYVMLSRWVLDGELEDPYGEFFIVADPQVKGERLWHDKYRVQSALVPSFVPVAEANKILAIGKSINFLREVCQDHTPLRGRDLLQNALETTSVEALFTPDRDGDLQQVMDAAYREISRRVLDVLYGSHKFLDNLQALRRYLLLGQGDFIRYLMELMDSELCKPASHLYGHNLSGILESAIRATNAQFEDTDILKRLDVRLLEQNPGDIGWDVFSLDYYVSGPISTIFTPSASSYLMLFNALWRAKRMEYVLAGTWKRQTTAVRMLRKLPEVAPVLQRAHLLTAEMIHLVQQMQYYTLFEVLECSWHELVEELRRAESLDGILTAHDRFLNKVKAGALLDEESARLAGQLRTIYTLVLQLQDLEKQLHTRALLELSARTQQEQLIEERGDKGQFGICNEEEQLAEQAQEDFVSGYLPHIHAKLRVLTKTYQDVVKQFLLDLADHPNTNLQLLSFRLDFNDHYKRRDSRLAAPYTYQHRRLSEMSHRMSPARGPEQRPIAK